MKKTAQIIESKTETKELQKNDCKIPKNRKISYEKPELVELGGVGDMTAAVEGSTTGYTTFG